MLITGSAQRSCAYLTLSVSLTRFSDRLLEACDVRTVFANDIDNTKAALYRENWGTVELRVADIRSLEGNDVPDVDVATASFPYIDTSIAGDRRGLNGEQSGLVFDFLRIIREMNERAPRAICRCPVILSV